MTCQEHFGTPLAKSHGEILLSAAALPNRRGAYNQLPSCDIELAQISTPTYLCRVRAEYDHHDTAAAVGA
jgi:hypothetical protein